MESHHGIHRFLLATFTCISFYNVKNNEFNLLFSIKAYRRALYILKLSKKTCHSISLIFHEDIKFNILNFRDIDVKSMKSACKIFCHSKIVHHILQSALNFGRWET